MLSQKLALSDAFQKVVTHLEYFGFVKLILKDGYLKNFDFGPAGSLLVENLRKEWIHSNVTNREKNVFMNDCMDSSNTTAKGLQFSFKSIKQVMNCEVPFGIAEIRKENTNEANDNERNMELSAFQPSSHRCMRYMAFLKPNDGPQFFYRWQQQRKRWWRQFSVNLGRYSFAEGQSIEGSIGEKVQILANFPWGDHCLETVTYHGPLPFSNLSMNEQNIFSVRIGGKRCFPHVMESVCSLDVGAFTYMCDSFKEKKGASKVCAFHRKLAPYKFAFAAGPDVSLHREELLNLCKFLSLGLRKIYLSTLLPSADFGKRNLNSQVSKYDALGVPYTLIVKPETLTNGIAWLHSRDTTLEEQVHVGKLIEYGEMLMKNY